MAEQILINFPTNIGDTIMGLPVLDGIRRRYPKSTITAIASSRTKDFLLRNNFINQVAVFDKFWKLKQKARFALSLRGKYDIVVDLKNSFLPVIVGAKKRTPFYRGSLKGMRLKDAYLKIARSLINYNQNTARSDFALTDEEKGKWNQLKLVPSLFIAGSSLSSLKRYPYEYLKKVIEVLLAKKLPLVILGETQDRNFYKDILSLGGIVDLVGKTTLNEVFYLLKNHARLLLCVDSSILHLGSYLNLPIVALFGPSDMVKFGPWSEKFIALRNKATQSLTDKSKVFVLGEELMKIPPEEALKAIEQLW